MKIILATKNKKKITEIQEKFKSFNIEHVSIKDIEGLPDIIEDGATFKDNASKKALVIAQHTGEVSLADDSGLVVDELHGRPGVFSARYAGENASDEDNYKKLLTELGATPEKKRTARFVCVIAIATPGGELHTAEGTCEGTITFEPQGTLGFGYDPVFFLPEYNKTMAEISMEEKNKISHRGEALEKAVPLLESILKKYL